MSETSKIAILGAGVTGKALADYFLEKQKKIFIFDDNYNSDIIDYVLKHKYKENISLILNPEYPFVFDDFEAVLLSPSFKLDKNYIISKNNFKNFYTEVDYFYPFIKDKEIIAVTGTNGKTSSVYLLKKLLLDSGRRVFLGGNVGIPIVKALENNYDTVVLELSSYQLYYTKNFKTDYSILLNLKPDHLKWHKDFEEYGRTKLKLADFTKKITFIHEDFLKFLKDIPSNAVIFDENTNCSVKKESIIKNKIPFWVNFIPIIKIMRILEIPEEKIIKSINEFETVKFRMTEKKIKNNLFVNDSKATNPDSTLFALKNYKNPILILGGDDKELDYTDFIKRLKNFKLKKILIFGGLKRLYGELDMENKYWFNTLRDIFNYLKKHDISNEIILFSPSSSSFDLYENYVERGKDFDLLTEEFFGK